MSKIFNYLVKPLFFSLSPENAHAFVVQLLKKKFIYGVIPNIKVNNDALVQNIFGHEFQNPVGLAAGFDKNAETLNAMYKFGFGYAEVGTVTPQPQPGNPKPRVFRFPEEEATINSLGFNNKGANEFEKNLSEARYPDSFKVGINIGVNKTSTDQLADYLLLLEKFYLKADYITVNISSPNTPGLRDLQHDEAFENLLFNLKLMQTNLLDRKKKHTSILIKISPDNSEADLEKIAEKIIKHKIDGVVLSNTTINEREKLKSGFVPTAGGVSGKPLFKKSTEVLARFYKLTEGKIPLIGVGGIMNGEDAYEKILKGASLLQIYTGLIYHGVGVVNEINRQILINLKRDGFNNITEAVGKGI